MSKLKKVLFDAFGIQMKAMKVVGADGKELEINKDAGAPAVGDVVTSDDGEYLQNDGTTIVVKDGNPMRSSLTAPATRVSPHCAISDIVGCAPAINTPPEAGPA